MQRIRRDTKGVSNIIVVALGLVIVVTIVVNVFLWNYEMNQLDWEKMKEAIEITDVARVTSSSWFEAQSEYTVNIGGRISGTYTDTQAVDGSSEKFREGLATLNHRYAFKSSDTRVSTTSGTPVSDSEAVLNITLEVDSHIFIIYNAGNKNGSAEDSAGKGCAISVDGENVAFSWQSPYAADSANSVSVVWAAFLSAGSHTIQGKFSANRAGYTVGIDTRQIIAYWFPTIVAEFVRSPVSVATTSSTPVDDTEAILNMTLHEDSVAFIIYNAGNRRGSNEPQRGKGITLNIDGYDIVTKEWQSSYGLQDANSVTITYVTPLTTGFHTVKGRFFSNSGQTTTIDERQLIAFCFPTDLVTYGFQESASPVSTASGDPVNDTEATLSTTLTASSDSLIIYTGGNPHGTTECRQGKGILVTVDGTELSNSSSWQAPQALNCANSITSVWNTQLAIGAHTIQGSFFSNNPGSASPTVTVSHRQLLILAFPTSAANYKLDLSGNFNLDISTYPLDFIQTIEMQLRYRADDAGEKWHLKAYNWSSSIYGDSGFNSTGGHSPTTGWDYYAVNLTDRWDSYVQENGTVYVKVVDEGIDSTRTTVDIEFLGVRVIIDGVEVTFSNRGPSTSHLVSLWINNSTRHRRYDISIFVNTGEPESYIRSDIRLPDKPYIVKVVTERGNIAIWSES